ncbi:MAG: radical SAM protein [Methanocellales archaeon]|nr:radical SAM protein [Methanocellales archaeon]
MLQARCQICGKTGLISNALKTCADCIRNRPAQAMPSIEKVHAESRLRFGLPSEPPREGVRCGRCVNDCRIPSGERGYCGLSVDVSGVVQCYYDPLPTNCVASHVCPNRTKYGYKNLAVFYGACSFNCLFCQNWHYREMVSRLAPMMSAEELASCVDDKTACICFFGGDPTPQLPHAIRTSKRAIERSKGIKICWESNGAMSHSLLKEVAELSLQTGGIVKFDLKAWNEDLHKALCGVTNERTLANFRWLAEYGEPSETFLVASTLLVPGYIDTEEVKHIAKFIADLNPSIPYSLLAFHPQFYMGDLPTTTRKHAERCLLVAKAVGLENVRIGNVHLLR